MEEVNKEENPIRDSLKDLLNTDLPERSDTDTPDNVPAFMEHEPMDYVTAKHKSTNSAKKLMKSLLDFYLSEELIEKNEYIQLKARVDVMTMANLIYQMQTAEHAITVLMRSIDSGEVSPRMFEVLGGLQKTLLEIMKHQTLHMMSSEENLKKLKKDIDIYSEKNESESKSLKIEDSKGTLVRGTRNLMKDIQNELNDIEIEDEDDFDSDSQTEL